MTNIDHEITRGQPGLVPAALFGLCPRCGARCLFAKGPWGFASFAPSCRACGLDYSVFNVGDGPAAFLTLIIGALVTGLALWVELAWHPPFMLHVVLWIPTTAVAVVWGLRVGKSALLAVEYQRHAHEAGTKDLREE